MCICSFLVWKNACLNYREFDLEGDLVGVPHTWYLSAQSFITLLKLICGEYDIVAMNEWKKKCVGLHRTWVSKRTVIFNKIIYHSTIETCLKRGDEVGDEQWKKMYRLACDMSLRVQFPKLNYILNCVSGNNFETYQRTEDIEKWIGH